ncbi:MAG: helix-turn-helix transcriptional regulator [Clostridia bacterium]|nr:helix-turn-helix transcriptional regulator [Clostridia bacterium]
MVEAKVGARIAKLRAEKNLTQAALGELLGVSDKTVSKWENGGCYPDVSLFPKLADTFGVTVDYLMRGEGRVVQKIAMGNHNTIGRDNELLAQGWRVANSHFGDCDNFPSYMLVLEKTEYDA